MKKKIESEWERVREQSRMMKKRKEKNTNQYSEVLHQFCWIFSPKTRTQGMATSEEGERGVAKEGEWEKEKEREERKMGLSCVGVHWMFLVLRKKTALQRIHTRECLRKREMFESSEFEGNKK